MKKLLVFILCLGLIGCATMEDVKKARAQVGGCRSSKVFNYPYEKVFKAVEEVSKTVYTLKKIDVNFKEKYIITLVATKKLIENTWYMAYFFEEIDATTTKVEIVHRMKETYLGPLIFGQLADTIFLKITEELKVMHGGV